MAGDARFKNIDAIRDLRRSAASLISFWPTWRTKYLADSNCDKKGAKFERVSDRFCSFSMRIMFSAYAGYYGNSSCGTLTVISTEMAEKYITAAINKHAQMIFETAADLMTADAAKLVADAESEVTALQAMLDDAKAVVAPESIAA